MTETKDKKLIDLYLEKIRDQEIFNGVHNFTILNNSLAWTAKKYFSPYYDSPLPCVSFSVAKETKSTYWVLTTQFADISREVFTKYWNDTSTIENLEKERLKKVKGIQKLYSKLTYDYIKNDDTETLAQDIQGMNDLAGYMDCLGWYCFMFEKEFVSDLLKKLGSSIDSNRLDELWEKLITPISLSFDKRSALETFDLIESDLDPQELAEKLQYVYTGFQGMSSLDEVIKRLQEEYLEYSSAEMREKLKQEINDEHKEKEKQYKEWLKTLNKEEQKLAQYTQHIIKVRDSLRDPVGMTITCVYRAAHEFFRRGGCDESLVDFCLFEEILKGPNYLLKIQDDLKKRKEEGFSTFVNYEDGEIYYEYGYDENFKLMEEKYAGQEGIEVDEDVKEIKGNIGSKGMAKGTVKIVIDIATETEKMEDGDILVTGMTRPEYVPLMKKASAIVTDEGGITCHAAIVSRELGKPCIIGTKNATKVLKDGDMVEVDADNGIVRILSR